MQVFVFSKCAIVFLIELLIRIVQSRNNVVCNIIVDTKGESVDFTTANRLVADAESLVQRARVEAAVVHCCIYSRHQ